MTTAIPRSLEPSPDGPAQAGRDAIAAATPRALAKSLAPLLGSNALISLTGLICLPLLFRNLGPASYGQLSLFLLGMGLLTSLDLARPTLVHELAGGQRSSQPGELLSLIGVSQGALVPLALAVGLLGFGPSAGLALGLGVHFFVASSGPYAVLAVRGRVGTAGAVRNLLWVAAFVGATLASTAGWGVAALAWPFALANAGVYLVNRHLAGPGSGALLPRPRLDVERRFRGRSADILGLGVATAVVVAADRLLLQWGTEGESFGRYAAQYDLAIKINVLSSALGTVLFPAYSRLVAERGRGAAARSFLRQLSWVVVAYFLGLLALTAFSGELLELVLGSEAGEGAVVLPLFFLGVFLALFGHLLTPWQRACGDFRTHRRVYAGTALWMVAFGAFAIPAWGALGAALTYLSARVADLALIACEARRLPREILPRRKLVLLGAMLLVLGAVALAQLAELGGAA